MAFPTFSHLQVNKQRNSSILEGSREMVILYLVCGFCVIETMLVLDLETKNINQKVEENL